MIVNCLAVGAGGFAGSICRYLISLIPVLNKGVIPFQTLLVNVVGAILIGIIVRSYEPGGWMSESTMLLLKVGICGGFTTFSTFSLESLQLMESGRIGAFAVYAGLSLILCIAGTLLGYRIGQSL